MHGGGWLVACTCACLPSFWALLFLINAFVCVCVVCCCLLVLPGLLWLVVPCLEAVFRSSRLCGCTGGRGQGWFAVGHLAPRCCVRAQGLRLRAGADPGALQSVGKFRRPLLPCPCLGAGDLAAERTQSCATVVGRGTPALCVRREGTADIPQPSQPDTALRDTSCKASRA